MVLLRYFVIYKPFGILSQFSGEKDTLKSLGEFPSDVYPVGRLDKDSEGLLIITNDKQLNHYLLDPKFGHKRTYWVQVEGQVDEEALASLRKGIPIKVNGKTHVTAPAKAGSIKSPGAILPKREPPIRYRKNVPDSWISLTLKEGKNRQVRKMTAVVGFPTLRLVRWSIGNLDINGYEVGEIREFDRQSIYDYVSHDGSVPQLKPQSHTKSAKEPGKRKNKK
jgi:23S rRNA pseudouridine2457 synthase